MSKRYVVTDPCYILPDTTWKECLEKCDEFASEANWSEVFNKEVEQALKDFTQGQAFVESTGFGDWSNTLEGPNVQGVGSFCADSGMVCVCELIGKVEQALGNIHDGCVAIFDAEGPLKVDFDTSDSDWTVVNIEDAEGNCWNTSIPDDDESWDEEDEDEE